MLIAYMNLSTQDGLYRSLSSLEYLLKHSPQIYFWEDQGGHEDDRFLLSHCHSEIQLLHVYTVEISSWQTNMTLYNLLLTAYVLQTQLLLTNLIPTQHPLVVCFSTRLANAAENILVSTSKRDWKMRGMASKFHEINVNKQHHQSTGRGSTAYCTLASF